MVDELASISKGLSHDLKRKVLRELYVARYLRFTELQRRLNVGNPSELHYHLKDLKDFNLVDQDHENNYRLTDIGRRTVHIIFRTEGVKPEPSGYVFDVKVWARLNMQDLSLSTVCERMKELKRFHLESMGEKYVEFRWHSEIAKALVRITKAGDVEVSAKIPLNAVCSKEVPSFDKDAELSTYQELACSVVNTLLLYALASIRKTWKEATLAAPPEKDWRITLG